MTAPRLGPNDEQPCGTDARRKHHWAHGQLCATCEPDLERPGRCPACLSRVTVVGTRYSDHAEQVLSGGRFVEIWRLCDGSGATAGRSGRWAA